MSIDLQSSHVAEEISLVTPKQISSKALTDTLEVNFENDSTNGGLSLPEDCSSTEIFLQKEEKPQSPELTSANKIQEIQDISPFRQAVKGFVINRFSKKVGSSYLLSGLSEKLVKKLEGIDHSTIATVCSEGDIHSLSSIKESITEISHESARNELKSVVANDLCESSVVEEAIDCLETLKASVDVCDSKNVSKTKATSKSQPTSPELIGGKQTSMDCESSSDSEEKSSVSESLATFSSKLFQNPDSDNAIPDPNKDIELKTMKKPLERTIGGAWNHNPLNSHYPENAYIGQKDHFKRFVSLKGCPHIFFTLKNLLKTLPLAHMFLLACIFIHHSNMFSAYYIDIIFDTIVLAYVCYTLVCTGIQNQILTELTQSERKDDPLGEHFIDTSNVEKSFKCSAKILKGNYSPDEENLSSTDLVDLCIENYYLKITRQLKQKVLNESDEQLCLPFEMYDLRGASVTLVPEYLIKRRKFRKRYPICITLSVSANNIIPNDANYGLVEREEDGTDFVTFIPYEDALLEKPRAKALYLYCATDREKESLFYELMKSIPQPETSPDNASLHKSSSKCDLASAPIRYTSLLEMNMEETLSVTEDASTSGSDLRLELGKSKSHLDFCDYMKTVCENYQRFLLINDYSCNLDPPVDDGEKGVKPIESFPVEWMNVILGRLFYDFLTQRQWSDYVMAKIQKKLDQIEMPNFVESLQVTDVFLGTSIPQLHTVSQPTVDNFGIWLDFEFTYNGSFQMTLQTKLKMPKGKQFEKVDMSESPGSRKSWDGSESSDEDDDRSGKSESPKQNKLLSRIEKWVSHKHFQTVAQNRFVKKYVGDISNMPLTLTVEVNLIQGTLAVNVPPIPTDRVWYGFRKDPMLSLTANPKVGTREINLTAVVKMIEQKLIRAFKRAIVMPNMDDVIIPIMFTPIYDK